jgi:hypothetical protein
LGWQQGMERRDSQLLNGSRKSMLTDIIIYASAPPHISPNLALQPSVHQSTEQWGDSNSANTHASNKGPWVTSWWSGSCCSS